MSLLKRVYGFPGHEDTRLDNLKVTAWRAISSLYNIGPEDLIFFYRTIGDDPGAQEFHGVFRVLTSNCIPMLLLHPKDDDYLPRLPERNGVFLPFRFIFESLVRNPISIPNDLRNKKNRKNNNLEIIKAMSETDSSKPRLWGFRHPAVMNIGAARKSSMVSVTHKQVKFLLKLLARGVERPSHPLNTGTKSYNISQFPPDCIVLDDEFVGKHFFRYVCASKTMMDYEAELYAYIISSLKNPKSLFHKDIMNDFDEVNNGLPIPFEEIAKNVILEAVVTPHIQEEIDILLCDIEEKNFLILEVKNGTVNPEDIEQTEKYVQLVNHQFPDNESVSANIIGMKHARTPKSSGRVRVVCYEMKALSGDRAMVNFKQASQFQDTLA